MALQCNSSLGVVSSVSLGMLLGCTGLLGIEEATCDVTYDTSCASTIESLVPAAGSGGAAPIASAAGSAGAAPAPEGGGSAGVATAAGAGGVGGSAPVVVRPLCDRYCETIAASCTEENEQYASPAACQAVCSRLEPGTPGSFTGNTVECRLARAELGGATGEPQNYCSSAGPGGGDVCGNDCEGFCAIMVATCDDLMGTFDECVSECLDNVPNLSGPPDNLAYDTSLQDGNSVQCRLFHVTAATLDPRTHCAHAAGLAVCAPPPVPVPDLP
jgi:hypothetical protein